MRLQLTQRDNDILTLMSRYTYLPGDYVAALVGGSRKVVLDRLGRMTREPYLLLNRPAWQRSKLDPNYRHLIYQLDDAGARLVGAPRPQIRGNSDHELLACCAMASVEIGARTEGTARLLTWDDIQASKGFHAARPQETLPFGLPAAFTLEGNRIKRTIVADTKPFGIERTIEGKKSWYFFPGIEADCNTEPVFTTNYKRASIYLKLAAYLAITESTIHRTCWGVPNLFVPIVTTSEEHKRSMMKLLDKMTAGAGSQHILFGVMRGFAFLDHPEPPSGRLLTQPWDRVGYPPLNLIQ